jgi:hypothetical protein
MAKAPQEIEQGPLGRGFKIWARGGQGEIKTGGGETTFEGEGERAKPDFITGKAPSWTTPFVCSLKSASGSREMKCQISRKICWRQGRVGRWFQDF